LSVNGITILVDITKVTSIPDNIPEDAKEMAYSSKKQGHVCHLTAVSRFVLFFCFTGFLPFLWL
jgi:hypothetical protein